MPRANHATEKPKSLGLATKVFLKSLRPWLFPIIISIILAIAATVCSIFGPDLLGQMTNSAVEDYTGAVVANGGNLPDADQLASAINWGKIGGIAVTLIILYVVSAVLNYVQGAILSVVSARYAKKMRSAIIDKISRLPISYFDQHQIGDTLSRMSNDIGTVSNTLANVLTQIITSITMLVGILIMMMTISVWLSVIALIAVPLSLIFVSFIASKSQKFFRDGQSTFGVINSAIEEDFSGQSIIKANSYEPTAIAKFEQTNNKLCELTWKANFLAQIAFPITNMFTNISYVAICVVGGRMAIDGTLLIGSVQAFLQYASQFNRPITEVSQIASNIQQTLAASERIFNFLEESEEAPDAEPA